MLLARQLRKEEIHKETILKTETMLLVRKRHKEEICKEIILKTEVILLVRQLRKEEIRKEQSIKATVVHQENQLHKEMNLKARATLPEMKIEKLKKKLKKHVVNCVFFFGVKSVNFF